MTQTPKPENVTTPKSNAKPTLVESRELSSTQLDQVAGGKPSVSDITIPKHIDKSSPSLG